jgi:hypothetical protein
MLLKTHIEKMSVLGFAIMYMKINNLKDFAIMLMILKAVTRRHRSRNAMTFGADTAIGADERGGEITIATIWGVQNMYNKPFDASHNTLYSCHTSSIKVCHKDSVHGSKPC